MKYKRVEYYNRIVKHQIVQYWNVATSNSAMLAAGTSQSATLI